MIFGKWSDRLLAPHAGKFMGDANITRHGGRNIMTWCKRYNRLRYAGRRRRHERAYRDRWNELLRANNGGSPVQTNVVMRDGWARDNSGTLPHLDRLLEQADEIIRARGGREHSSTQQPFLRSLMFPGDIERYSAFLDFVTSSALLDVAARHLDTTPVLAKTRPPGIRFMESNRALDPEADGPYRESQLHHLDLHDSPLVYVLVMARDIPPEAGPWHFLPAGVSDRVCKTSRYRERGVPYRMSDKAMARHARPEEEILFTGKKGDVLFIDSGRCFHYGSRDCTEPRFQIMYALTTPCRTDISQTFIPETDYGISPQDSELRRMVLERG